MKKVKYKTPLPEILQEIKNYKPLTMDYSFQKSISYSAFSIYSGCPHRWSLSYKDGHYQKAQSISMSFGTALHNTIQNYLTVMYSSTVAAADRVNLEEYFQEQLSQTYIDSVKENNGQHFSTAVEMREFYDDGVKILEFLKKKKQKYFSKRGTYLVGCEVPILIQPYNRFKNVILKGFIDLVTYNENVDKFTIYDIKTSTVSWGDKQKKDPIKLAQVLFYKKYFSEQFGVPIDKIDVQFFILKRKIPENTDFPIYPIQEFKPSQGKTSVNKAISNLEKFIENCFDNNGMKQIEHKPNPSQWNCKYCPFKTDKNLCKVGIS